MMRRTTAIPDLRHYNTLNDALISWNYHGFRLVNVKKVNDTYLVDATDRHENLFTTGPTVESALQKLIGVIDKQDAAK